MSESTLYLKGRKWRHGYRVEGSYVQRKFGKPHLFFKSEKEALEVLKSQDTHETRPQEEPQ